MQLADQLTRAFATMGRYLRSQAGDLAKPDLATLGRLAAHQGSTRLRDLACSEGVDPSTLSRRITSLVERGLVERTPDPQDGRAHVLSVTDHGRATLEAVREQRIERITGALAEWDDADKAEFARLLGRLSDSLEASMATASAFATTATSGATERRREPVA